MADLGNCSSRLKASDSIGQATGLSNENDADRSIDADNESQAVGLVHVFHAGGHRTTYQNFLASLFGLKPLTGPIKWSTGLQLVKADRLLFATISKRTAFKAMIIAFFRACIGKRTCAICMEGEWYLDKRRRFQSAIALRLFRLLDALDRLKVYCVIPFDLMPELSKTTSGWILDLCLWDFLNQPQSAVRVTTALSKRAENAAGGRKILLFLGKASRRKGYDKLVSISSKISKQVLIVTAGRVAEDCEKSAEVLREKGMVVEDRVISEDELISLYGIADYVWCRYDESSNSLSSGVFGRAVQLGRTAVVPEGSYLDRLARLLGHPILHDLDAENLSGDLSHREDNRCSSSGKHGKDRLSIMARESMRKLERSL